jgi:hypothetical protein
MTWPGFELGTPTNIDLSASRQSRCDSFHHQVIIPPLTGSIYVRVFAVKCTGKKLIGKSCMKKYG